MNFSIEINLCISTTLFSIVFLQLPIHKLSPCLGSDSNLFSVCFRTVTESCAARLRIFSTSSGVRLTAAPFAHSSPQSQLQHVGLSNSHRLWCLETFLEAFKFRFFYEVVGKVVWLQLDFFPPHICVGFLFFAVHSCPSIPSVLRRPSPTQLSHTQLTHS